MSSSSSIKDHWSQVTITNQTIMKNLEVTWELPKGDRHKVSKCCEKNCTAELLDAGLREPSICKKMKSLQSAIKQGTLILPFALQYALLCRMKEEGFIGKCKFEVVVIKNKLKTSHLQDSICSWKILITATNISFPQTKSFFFFFWPFFALAVAYGGSQS